MKWMKRPCRMCRRKDCEELDCGRWQVWFLDAWGAVNRYAWARLDEAGRRSEDVFRYALPHEEPCKGCPSAEWCDTPCARRLQWWDMAMANLRRKLEAAGEKR